MKKVVTGLLAGLLTLTAFSCEAPFANVKEQAKDETVRFNNIVDHGYAVIRKDNGKTVHFGATRGNDKDPNWVYLYFIRSGQMDDALDALKDIALWIEDGRVNPHAPINYYKEDSSHFDQLCISKGTYIVKDLGL